LAVPGRFMAAINDLLCQLRMFFDRLPDHVRRHLNANPIPHIEHARNTFLKTILVPLLNG
jgi:hypothetical protein